MHFELGTCDLGETNDAARQERMADLGLTVVKQAAGYPSRGEDCVPGYVALKERGLDVIVDLRCTAEWMTPPDDVKTKEDFYAWCAYIDQLFTRWCIEFIGATHEHVRAFELWSEPQCPLSTQGLVSPERLAYWLHLIRQVVGKDINIVNGGLGLGPWKEVELDQMAEANTFAFIDALNLHPFSFQRTVKVQRMFYEWMLAYCYLLMEERGRAGLPIMMTEWGYPSSILAGSGLMLVSKVVPAGIPPVSEELQAEIMDSVFELFWQHDIGPICLITHDIDVPANPNFWSYHCGVVRADGTPKPSYEVVKKWAQRAKGKAPIYRCPRCEWDSKTKTCLRCGSVEAKSVRGRRAKG